MKIYCSIMAINSYFLLVCCFGCLFVEIKKSVFSCMSSLNFWLILCHILRFLCLWLRICTTKTITLSVFIPQIFWLFFCLHIFMKNMKNWQMRHNNILESMPEISHFSASAASRNKTKNKTTFETQMFLQNLIGMTKWSFVLF